MKKKQQQKNLTINGGECSEDVNNGKKIHK